MDIRGSNRIRGQDKIPRKPKNHVGNHVGLIDVIVFIIFIIIGFLAFSLAKNYYCEHYGNPYSQKSYCYDEKTDCELRCELEINTGGCECENKKQQNVSILTTENAV